MSLPSLTVHSIPILKDPITTALEDEIKELISLSGGLIQNRSFGMVSHHKESHKAHKINVKYFYKVIFYPNPQLSYNGGWRSPLTCENICESIESAKIKCLKDVLFVIYSEYRVLTS